MNSTLLHFWLWSYVYCRRFFGIIILTKVYHLNKLNFFSSWFFKLIVELWNGFYFYLSHIWLKMDLHMSMCLLVVNKYKNSIFVINLLNSWLHLEWCIFIRYTCLVEWTVHMDLSLVSPANRFSVKRFSNYVIDVSFLCSYVIL